MITTPSPTMGAAQDGPPLVAGLDTEVPRLTTGVELIGLYEDSGFEEPPCIARRGDGQIVQLAPLLYALAEQVDGRRTVPEIAEAFSERIERGVAPEMVRELLDQQLRPLGIVALADGHTGQHQKLDPLLALKFRTRVIPDGVVRSITTVFRPLFYPPMLAAALLAFVALDVWLFGVHGISQGLRHVLYQPALLLLLLAGVVVATAFHEIGHATAVRYGGANPGVMGVGIYIVWPAFYTDITDAYRLGKWGRLRADTGGMYFNALFALATAGVYAATGFEPLLLLVVLQNFTIVQQSLPLLRLDGYYIISDLTGVPDMLSRVRPVLRSLLPGREPDARVTALKPWVRRVVTGYVMTVIPVIAVMFLLMLVHAPRAFATGYDSVLLHTRTAKAAFSHSDTGLGLMQAFQSLVLVLPAVGMVYSFGRVTRRTAPAAWRWSADSASRRTGLFAGTAAVAAALAFLWWPHGDYRPIQPGERGTLVSAIKSLRNVPSGRASLMPERRVELRDAPLRSSHVRDRQSAKDHKPSGVFGTPGRGSGQAEDGTTTDSTDETTTVPTETTPPSTSTNPGSTTTTPTTTAPTTTTPTTTTTEPTTTTPTTTTPTTP